MAIDVYLQIDSIKGESMDAGHLGNDNRIPGVRHWTRHDDHFHVGIKVGQK